jgi:hypothetical protein
MNRFKGSVRSATAAASSLSSAPGRWTLTEATQARQNAAWPNASPGGSILFNGSSQYLSVNAAQKPTTLGNNLFTIEMFVRFSALPANGGLASLSCTSDINFRFFLHGAATAGDGIMTVWEGSNIRWTSAASGILANTWYHVCIMRSNIGDTTSVLNFYVNGVSIATTNPRAAVTWVTGGMIIGAETSPQYVVNGNITNYRYVNGTAVYSVAGFTPPTAPLTNITNTKLLLLALNGTTFANDSSTANSGSGYPVTNVGGATFSALTPF